MMECKRCGRTEEDSKIFSNHYCERCDRLLFDRYTPYYPIVYPNWTYEFTWTYDPDNTSTGGNYAKIIRLDTNTTSSVVSE